jgi:hypothetical protein
MILNVQKLVATYSSAGKYQGMIGVWSSGVVTYPSIPFVSGAIYVALNIPNKKLGDIFSLLDKMK